MPDYAIDDVLSIKQNLLDIQCDEGRANLDDVGGAELDRVAGRFEMTRGMGESDETLRARVARALVRG